MKITFDLIAAARRAAPANLRRPSAFTLIELLVVIAIISLLAAILFPVFARARESARKTSCMSNLKQVGMAVMQYSQDYDEMTVPYVLQDLSISTSTVYHWHGAQIRTSSPHIFDPVNGLIQPYLKSYQVQDCPSAKGYPGHPTQINGALFPAYAVNRRVFPDVRFNVGHANYEAPVKLSQIEIPAETMLMCDSIEAGDPNAMTRVPFLFQPTSGTNTRLPERFHGRHNELGNVLWSDGHVKAMRPSYRAPGADAVSDARRAKNVGMLSPLAELPGSMSPNDPLQPKWDYYFTLNKTTGK